MRAFIAGAVLTVAILTVNPVSATPHHGRYESLVDRWYHRYLGRHVDPVGLHDHVQSLHRGAPREAVEASILDSREYYHRAGSTAEGFVAALYRDVLGRGISIHELRREAEHVRIHGRMHAIRHVLRERSGTVTSSYAPPVIVTHPSVIVPSYRHAPVVIDPLPAISIRFNFGR